MNEFTDETWTLQPSLPLNNVFNKLTRNGVKKMIGILKYTYVLNDVIKPFAYQTPEETLMAWK